MGGSAGAGCSWSRSRSRRKGSRPRSAGCRKASSRPHRLAARLTGERGSRETRRMLLLCGATGQLGGLVARRLAAEDAPLRLLLRSGAGDPLAAELGAEVAYGDLRDPGALDAAVRGATTVVTTVTAMGRALSGERLSPVAVDGRGTLALVD